MSFKKPDARSENKDYLKDLQSVQNILIFKLQIKNVRNTFILHHKKLINCV
jgi:hypothetical protein